MSKDLNNTIVSRGACPHEGCGSSDAYTVYADGHTKCYSCRKQTFPQRNVELNPYKVSGEIVSALFERKITKQTADKFGTTVVGYGTDNYTHRYKYVDSNGSKVATKTRKISDKAFGCEGNLHKAVLYGQHLFKKGGKYVTICEGEVDAMSVYQMLGKKYPNSPCVSVKSGATSAKKNVKENFEFLDSFENVVLCFDNDEAGNKASEEVAQLFSPKKCRVISLELNDPSAYLVEDKEADFIRSWWNAEPYTPAGIINLQKLGEDLFKDEDVYSCPFPWSDLNDSTYGMRGKELITFTSGAGMGKSSIVRELMHHLLLNTKDNIGVLALEESIKNTALSIMSVSANARLYIKEIRDKYSLKELKKWQDETVNTGRFYAFDHFGSIGNDEILSRVRFMAQALDCKWIIIDHLSIIVSGQEIDDERKTIDVIMSKLRSIVEQTGVGMLLVSHLRRPQGDKDFNDGREVSLGHLRGSASIAQLSDSVIALERDQQASDERLAHTLKVRILKNRYCGTLGVACHLFYDKNTGRLKQVDNPFLDGADTDSIYEGAF